MARIVPVVRVKKDASRKLPYLVYYRQGGRPVYCGYYKAKTGETGANAARDAKQAELYRLFGSPEAKSDRTGLFKSHLADFYAYHERIGSAPDTVAFYKLKLGYLEKQIGSVPFADLSRSIVRQAIKAAKNGQTWEKGVLRAFGAYLNWGHSQEPPICQPSFARFVDLEHRREARHKNYFPPNEVAMFFALCHREEARRQGKNPGWIDRRKHALALRFFAGIRTREIDRLRCEFVDRRAREIHITDATGKTAGILQGLPPVLWEWLADLPAEGPVYPGRSDEMIRNAKRCLPLGEAKGATPRRTCLTMASNAYGVEQARKWARHNRNLTTLETHYLGCVCYRKGKPVIANKRLAVAHFALTPRLVRLWAALCGFS